MTDSELVTTDAWTVLLERVRVNIPSMLDEFLIELANLEGYQDDRVSATDLEGTAKQVFELFLDRLHPSSHTTGNESDQRFTRALGRRRARQGMRIDHFAEAVRINFRLFWRALHQASQPDIVEVLMQNGERVLDVVERYATEVQRSFLDETESMARSRRSARERALMKIFSASSREEDFSKAASALGLPCNGVFELIAMKSNALPVSLNDELRRQNAFSYEDETMTYVFRLRRRTTNWIDSSPQLSGAYIGHVPSLSRISDAAKLAKLLSSAPGNEGAITLRSGFAPLAASLLENTLLGFEHELIGDFSTSRNEKHERLHETIREYLGSGSVQETADKLYLHRNTVFKRLQTFQEISGLDVTVPRDAAIALVLTSEQYQTPPAS